jgi:energy-coupling factor transporter ATP-binding protein EcfA2
MGELIKSFTFGRNALKRTVSDSADTAFSYLNSAMQGVNLSELKSEDNGKYNVFRDFISFLGILGREGDSAVVTDVGKAFIRLYGQSPEDSWRWLITRSLWLYVVPNGTGSHVNAKSNELGFGFSFFQLMLGMLAMMAGITGNDRFLLYTEVCYLLEDDLNWNASPDKLFDKLLRLRSESKLAVGSRGLLGDLEVEYEVPRDNLNTVFNKAFQQTGLFDYLTAGGKTLGIALSGSLDAVMSSRVRFVIDHPTIYSGQWQEHLKIKSSDMPQDVSLTKLVEVDEEPAQQGILELVGNAARDINEAGLRVDRDLITRLASSLLAKPFVILTGLSGSGKTKLAQAFATWLCPGSEQYHIKVGMKFNLDGVICEVAAVDRISIEVVAGGGEVFVFSKGLVDEWVTFVSVNGIKEQAAADYIGSLVSGISKFVRQSSSYELVLKALVYHIITSKVRHAVRHLEVVPVNADWVNKESFLGYPDALNSGRYVRTSAALDLIIKARNDISSPYFLVFDEMNLSHVERYFSDFLSAMESGGEIMLHSGLGEIDGVPGSICIPPNLFIIGTVNVDETTYSFSPKVLDRANVIEFKVNEVDIESFIHDPKGIDIDRLSGKGRMFSAAFVLEAGRAVAVPELKDKVGAELQLLFKLLSGYNREFGFRVAHEIMRFTYFYEVLTNKNASLIQIVDAQLYQKILPKLNGSRRRLESVLCGLASFCCIKRDWGEGSEILNAVDILSESSRYAIDGTFEFTENVSDIVFPMSYMKIRKMLDQLGDEGFVSFAEA